MTYYSLHNHTDFSNASCGFMDSINKTEDLINHAYKIGLRGLAVTDHESVSSHIKAVQHYKSMLEKAKDNPEELAKVKDFRLMLGNEIYLARPNLTKETHVKGERFYHMILIALDKTGHRQIRELSSKAWSRSYMNAVQRRYNINSDFTDVIGSDTGHIIATTACIGGVTGTTFLTDTPENAKLTINAFLERMSVVFGVENFFIELAPSKYIDQIEYNKFMYKYYNGKYKFIITTDTHYLTSKDFEVFKAILTTGDGERELDAFYKYSHMMTWEEITALCDYLPSQFLESCRTNTLKIGERAEYYDLAEPSRIPRIPFINIEDRIPRDAKQYEYINKFYQSDYDQDIYYVSLIMRGLDKLIPLEDREETLKRIDLELSEVWGISEALNQRMSDYLITVAKVIDVMWEDADAIVGPGRGSAVAFVTNYLLGITQLNPLKYPVEIPHWRLTH